MRDVWNAGDQPPFRVNRSTYAAQRRPGIAQMLQHVEAKNDLKLLGKRGAFPLDIRDPNIEPFQLCAVCGLTQ